MLPFVWVLSQSQRGNGAVASAFVVTGSSPWGHHGYSIPPNRKGREVAGLGPFSPDHGKMERWNRFCQCFLLLHHDHRLSPITRDRAQMENLSSFPSSRLYRHIHTYNETHIHTQAHKTCSTITDVALVTGQAHRHIFCVT